MKDKTIRLNVNGATREATPRDGLSLLLYLRGELGLTGAKQGCGSGDCGACTVLVDGTATKSCITTLAAVEGADIQTIEALSATPRGAVLTRALIAEGAAQCGYCLPGIVAAALGSDAPDATTLDRNICRCGTHHRILAALRHGASDD
ncbi:(2Fe-2S)-binding protein [Hasllibacter sp. MH4015]|uniref:(2Fe-2S)-binding protein n=1 Tax=Hasllibacter sp. MH4015 TaxID=2854029 RepID=UPI001CD48380|nr:2Fe-2S iron-sulfur cluster-binding protein [Hasllibacter sp. MH4015]